MQDAILALNSGSSSVKFALFSAGDSPALLARGAMETTGQPTLSITNPAGETIARQQFDHPGEDPAHALLETVLNWAETHTTLRAAGHRIVHGGADFTAPVHITGDTLHRIQALTPLDPLHQPACLRPVQSLLAHRPNLPQTASFDTAFHATIPAQASHLALPDDVTAHGVRRYGFHGLSYDHIATRLRTIDPHLAEARTLVAHLGSGASLCAMLGGRSQDTTMGFSTLDGLVMGTRCGALDPGVILFMMKTLGYDHDRIEQTLYHQSGLLGVSGFSADMRALVEARADTPRAADAIAVFLHRLTREAGAMIASLGGVDGIVFTGGIGEHAPFVRASLCEQLRWLGIVLDPEANTHARPVISTPDSRVTVRIEPANEESVIVRDALHLLSHA